MTNTDHRNFLKNQSFSKYFPAWFRNIYFDCKTLAFFSITTCWNIKAIQFKFQNETQCNPFTKQKLNILKSTWKFCKKCSNIALRILFIFWVPGCIDANSSIIMKIISKRNLSSCWLLRVTSGLSEKKFCRRANYARPLNLKFALK